MQNKIFNNKYLHRQFESFGLLLLISCVLVQSSTINTQDLDEDIKVRVDVTPYSLQFTLIETEETVLENVTCKNIKNDEIIGNDEHICENLEPCSSYLAVLHLRYQNSSQTYEKTVDAKTAYTQPTSHIESVVAYPDKITISWSATDISCITSFEVIAETTGNQVKNKIFNDEIFYQFENLVPCQYYFLQLVTYVNSTVNISTESAFTTTEYTEPGDLTLTIDNLDNGDTQISWREPTAKTCIEKLTLKWALINCLDDGDRDTTTTISDYDVYTTDPDSTEDIRDICEWTETLTNPKDVQYNIKDLQGCEEYIIKIFINQNETAKAAQEFTSAEKLPSAVSKDEGWLIYSTSIEMHWTTPKDHSKCLLRYSIKLSGPNQRDKESTIITTTSKNYAVFENLDPCGQYNLQITPLALNETFNENSVMDVSFQTLEAKPSQILDPLFTAEAYTLVISWSKPAFADLCLTGYQLSGWRDDHVPVDALSKETTESYAIYDKDLNSCQAYIVKIIPTTATMVGDSVEIEIEMNASAVDVAKINFQSLSEFSDSLELSAQNLDFNNTCQTIFAHFYCETRLSVPHQYAEKYVEGHVGDISFKATLFPLSPYTEYGCHVRFYNVAGASKDLVIVPRTDPYFPGLPRDLTLTDTSNRSMKFSWKTPTFPNGGTIKLYILHFQRYEAGYFVPPSCESISVEGSSLTNAGFEQTFSNLLPATRYSIQVAAQNEYGIGQYTLPKLYETLPSVSEAVIGLKMVTEGPDKSELEYKANVTVSWLVPCKSNGPIQEFVVNFLGQRENQTVEFVRDGLLPNYNSAGYMMYNENNLQPEFDYTVTVQIKTRGVDELSIGTSDRFEAPAGIPRKLSEKIIAKTRVNAFETNHPTSSVEVRIPAEVFKSDAGTINYLALLISQLDCNDTSLMQCDALDTEKNWPNTASWRSVYEENSNDCIRQYQTTPLRWSPQVTAAKVAQSSKNADEIVFIIGTEQCTKENQYFCNGPLRADTQYNLVIRLFTKSGYNDAALLVFKTNSAIKVTIILIACCSCLFMAFIVGLVVLWVRKRLAWHRDSCQGIQDPLGNITAKNFVISYEEISKPEKISREFKEIAVVALELSYSASELGSHKNRYADIYPYDKNRVILDMNADGSDYINASFVDGYTRKKEYIATQGPKPETVIDFWRMILQYNVRVIVMLTQLREGNQIKCHEYFPYSAKGINVVIKSKETFELYDRTEMTVAHEKIGIKEKVVHFYFKKWPDHGCPDDPMHLINFIRKVKSEKRSSYSPIVVHCSAGVGRTGTFIGMDIVKQRLKSESKINIFETVKKLRFQRMKMVQTLEQYSLLYTCTYALVRNKLPRAVLRNTNATKVSSVEQVQKNNVTVESVNDKENSYVKHNDLVFAVSTRYEKKNQNNSLAFDEHPSNKERHYYDNESESTM